MDLFFSLMISPAAFAALIAALYWMYPIALLHGYKRFGGYLIAGLARKFIEVGGISYSYFERAPQLSEEDSDSQQADSEPVTILFLHGFTANKTMWMLMSKYLPKEWRLIMLDLPGHGESTFKEDGNYSALGLAGKVNEFVEAMELKSFHLVGISLGALISASYASKYQERLKSITLMCPPGAHKLPKGVTTKLIEALEKGKDNPLMPKNGKEFQEMMELVLYNPKAYTFHQGMRNALVQIQQPNYSHFKAIQNDLFGGNENEEFICELAGKIRAPTLILWGEHDRVCHPSGAGILQDLIKGSEVIFVDKCGHAMTMDRPRKCAGLVKNFIHESTRSTTACH